MPLAPPEPRPANGSAAFEEVFDGVSVVDKAWSLLPVSPSLALDASRPDFISLFDGSTSTPFSYACTASSNLPEAKRA